MPPKRRRKIHGLYYHSSPPKVFPMHQMKSKLQDNGNNKEAIIIKPSNIRIWIHDKDLGKLARVLWEGQGNRLRTEVSSNTKVKKFLDAVPFVMNIIKEIHSAVVDNDLDGLIAKTSPPVPSVLLSSKDSNGLTPLHKASGLAHTRIVEYLLSVWPDAATDMDFTGKTPLHWAASAKNNSRSYNFLVQAGCDEQALDYKMKTPAHYKNKPNDIDRSMLTVIPDAPRVPQQGLPPGYDWAMLGDDTSKFMNNNNNFLKKSQSSYESYTILSGASSAIRRGSSEAIRNGNLLSPETAKLRNSLDNTDESNLLDNEDDNIEPLTTEEQAVLAAINPESEKLYAKSNSSSARADTPIPLLNEDKEDENYNIEDELNDIDEAIPTAATELEQDTLATGMSLVSDDAVENNDAVIALEENDDETIVNGGYDDDNGNNDDLGKVEEIDDIDEGEVKEGESDDEDKNNDEAETVDDQTEEIENVDEQIAEEESISNKHVENFEDIYNGDDEEENDENLVIEVEEIGQEVKNSENEIDPDLNNDDETDELDPTNKNEEKEPNENDDEALNFENENEQEQTHDNDDHNEQEISPSPALQIEGVVRGEPDNGGLQSEGGQFHMDDDEELKIKSIISSGDMEQLAVLVLNGEGRRLIGMTSNQPEIQAFLDNVPAYMNKIRRVHLASREGSLRDLQSALDRRKFAVAKDDISPNGATPLHVSSIFGHAGIIRYLAGRFPETTSAVDNDGRTALHYAATINDNGHFFNLLLHLGGNPKAEDNMGNSAEFYLNHEQSESVLSHRQLLKDFGAHEDLADDMLNDQEFGDSSQVEIPLFRTEEGRYLATTLGDPLIKGLTEVANSRPTDPIAFLANYLNGFVKQSAMTSTDEIKSEQIVEETPMKEVLNEKRNSIVQQEIVDEPPQTADGPELAQTSDDRDEHGQSLLHFACARSHGRNALVQLIEESAVSITYRDELYRTARDVSQQASQPENTKEIDRYVMSFAASGDLEKFENLLIEGYDHILDIVDENDGKTSLQVAQARGHAELVEFFEYIKEFEENREKLHRAIRTENVTEVKRILSFPDAAKLARAKNYYGRCSIHVAVLKENEEIVDYISTKFKQILRIGDNLERTPLHYSMGVSSVEAISRILIKNEAKRVLKDLKGRQPSYYFMNKADILRLKEEEEEEDE